MLEQLRDIYNKNSVDKYYVLVIDDTDIKDMLILREKGFKSDKILESKLKELTFNFVKWEIEYVLYYTQNWKYYLHN